MKFENIGQLLKEITGKYSGNTALRYKKDDKWLSLSYGDFGEKIKSLAAAMIDAGIKKGDNVGIYSPNRYEWNMVDFACVFCRAVSVPIYATSTRKQVEFIIKDAAIRFIFAGSDFQYSNVAAIRSEVPLQVVTFDPETDIDRSFATHFSTFIDKEINEFTSEEIDRRLQAIRRDDTTTIIYTSGTTGVPKGVMLTHANMFHQIEALEVDFNVNSKDVSLCFLPLSHVYERMWSYYVYYKGAVNTYLDDPKKVIETMQEVKPTAMVSVPRLYEKIYAAVMNSQENASAVKQKLFKKAIKTGEAYYTKSYAGQPIPVRLKLQHNLYDKLVLHKIRQVVGGEKNFFSAGGAPLEKQIEEFFFACGLLICQGYGLTETSPMVSCNSPVTFKFGTVGRPVKECQVRIAENGEVQVKGPMVMKGYYNNPEATAEVIENGWFKTGDIGEVDADGFLKITGRIKEIIITSGGKNIAPLRIETMVGKDFFIEQIIAIGDKRNFISALVVPSFDVLEAWAKQKEIFYNSLEELVNHPMVVNLYQKRIDMQSRLLAKYETIKKFRILPKPFSQEDGSLTPTLKLKRDQIHQKFQELIDAMYNREEKK